jgi:diguanylate cyclase (GGDEF)-like protein
MKRLEAKANLELAFRDCRNKTKEGELYVAFFDGNKIKQINDTFGHLMGDFVIERIVTINYSCIRKEDRLVRCGGDEFVLFLPNFAEEHIKSWILRIQNAIKYDKELLKKVGGVTTSVGVVQFSSKKHKDLVGVLGQADALMYKAKKSKKSDYCMFDSDFESIHKNSRKASKANNTFDIKYKIL